MFDLQDETLTRVKKDTPIDRLPETPVGEAEAAPQDPLDSAQGIERHAMLLSYYRQEIDRQSQNRSDQSVEEDYYDNIQWSEEDAQVLKDRGQAPLVYNVIAQSVNWIIGSEKRARTDFKVLPRGKEDAKQAEGKTKYMKYLSDVNHTPFNRSRAFEDTVKVGIGWLEAGAQDDDEDGEPIYDRYESWRNIIWDSASTELDCSDMRYIFRTKWVDEDIAKALFPQRADLVTRAVQSNDFAMSFMSEDGDPAMDSAELDMDSRSLMASHLVSHQRRRVRLIEGWYRVPEQVDVMRGGPFSGKNFDQNNPDHAEAVGTGMAKLSKRTVMRIRCAIFTTVGLLYDGASPYKHNRYPFIPIWGFRRGRDGLPYGVIRWMKDLQDDINKRASKAQHILSTNKVIMDEGALPDDMTIDEFADEVSRSDAIITVRAGKRMELNVDRDLAPAHLDLMTREIGMIQQVGGVTDELMGRSTNATSGVAIQARQDQGSVATNKLFDNLHFAVQMMGEIELSLVEQFVTEQKQFRITNQRGTPEYIAVNDGLPENDITRTKADFVVAEQPWNATIRQSQSQQLSDMMMKMPPEVAMILLDLVVEGMELPNRDELVKRVRSVNGQRDPDQEEPTPEEMAKMQAQQQQQQLQARAVLAEIAGKEADAALKAAQAKKAGMETEKAHADTISVSMDAIDKSMVAAQSIIMMPTIGKVADALLAEAGWPQPTIPTPAAMGLPPVAQQQQMPSQPPAPMPQPAPAPAVQ